VKRRHEGGGRFFDPSYGEHDDADLDEAFWLVESPCNRAVALRAPERDEMPPTGLDPKQTVEAEQRDPAEVTGNEETTLLCNTMRLSQWVQMLPKALYANGRPTAATSVLGETFLPRLVD